MGDVTFASLGNVFKMPEHKRNGSSARVPVVDHENSFLGCSCCKSMNLVTFHSIDQAKPGDKAKGLNIEKYQSSVTHKWFRNMQAFAKVWDPFLILITLKQMTAWKLSYTL